MTIKYHVLEETLLAYAAGELDNASSLLVATHLALCPKCRRAAEIGDEIGGALIETVAPATMGSAALDSVMARLEEFAPEGSIKPVAATKRGATPVLPEPLRSRVGGDVDVLRWRRLGPGLQQIRLDDKSGGPSVRLLKIAGGRSVPEHGHAGAEMTMVLAGGFHDAGRSFGRGDIEWANADVVHQPVADEGEDCICLTVTDGPLKFFDVIGRLAQPFVGI
jgi:putative transcriptional regulator